MGERDLQRVLELTSGKFRLGFRIRQRERTSLRFEAGGFVVELIRGTGAPPNGDVGPLRFQVGLGATKIINLCRRGDLRTGGGVDLGDHLRLRRKKIGGGFATARLGFGDRAFVVIEEWQLEGESKAPFILPLVPHIARAEVEIGKLAGNLEGERGLARIITCERGKNVGS